MTDNLASALALVQTKLPEIDKSKTATVQTKSGGSYSYAYADLAAVSKEILPLLGDCGLSWMTKPTLTEDGKLVLEYKLMHVSGESEEGTYPLPQSGTPQEIGSAITYARRYTLCSVTGVAPEQDDDDGTAATATKPKTRKAAEKATQATEATPPRKVQRRPVEPDLPDDKEPPKPTEITKPQLAKLVILFNQLGWTDRDDRLRAASTIVGRKLESSKELSVREASRLIEKLQECSEQDDPQMALTDLLASLGRKDEDGQSKAEPIQEST